MELLCPAGSLPALKTAVDNGADAVIELERVLTLRAQALQNFNSKALADGRPYSDLAEILVPVYFAHRYQTEAAGKYA